MGTPAQDKALAQHLKATVGASKEFIDAYITQLYKSFKKTIKESVDEAAIMLADLEKVKGVNNAYVEGKDIIFTFKGNDFFLKNRKGTWDLLVNGYKRSLEAGSDLQNAGAVIDVARHINDKWFKENDPDYR